MNMKKLFLLNLPYLLFVYPFDKLAQAFRLAPGADLSGKLLSIGDGFKAVLSSPWLSFQPTDLLIGIAGAVVLRMAVYLKGKNAKKYRHGIEYGSARWGTAADIAPYMDRCNAVGETKENGASFCGTESIGSTKRCQKRVGADCTRAKRFGG